MKDVCFCFLHSPYVLHLLIDRQSVKHQYELEHISISEGKLPQTFKAPRSLEIMNLSVVNYAE